jgi:hypothetical protein
MKIDKKCIEIKCLSNKKIWLVLVLLLFSVLLTFDNKSAFANDNDDFALRKKSKSQILQTMLYCWAVSEQYPAIAPYVYSVRRISDISTTTCVHAIGSNEPIVFDEQMKKEFVDQLVLLVDEIRNLEMPFYPCINDNVCKSCSFISLCGR